MMGLILIIAHIVHQILVLYTYVTNSVILKGTKTLTHKIKLIDDDNDPLLFTNEIDN